MSFFSALCVSCRDVWPIVWPISVLSWRLTDRLTNQYPILTFDQSDSDFDVLTSSRVLMCEICVFLLLDTTHPSTSYKPSSWFSIWRTHKAPVSVYAQVGASEISCLWGKKRFLSWKMRVHSKILQWMSLILPLSNVVLRAFVYWSNPCLDVQMAARAQTHTNAIWRPLNQRTTEEKSSATKLMCVFAVYFWAILGPAVL